MINREYRSKLSKTLTLFPALGIGLFGAVLAEAQGEVLELEEVLVTAQKREQRLMEVPIALQAFNGNDLEARGMGDLTRFINEIPGASTNISWSPSITQVQLRGSGVTGQQGSAVVGFYVDDVPFIIPNAQLAPISSMFDLERVEVLRGPQGTLWGLGSMGGTIRYITPNPDLRNFDGKFRGTVSNMEDGDNGYSADAMLNLPIVEGVFGVRLSGGIDDFSGFSESLDFPDEEDVNDGETKHLRVKALWDVSDSVSVTASYLHIETEQGFNNVVDVLEPPTIGPAGGFRGFTGGESDQYNITLNWSLDFADLVSTSTYLEHLGPFGLGFGAVPVNGNVVSITDAESFAQELRLVSASDGPLSWITGVFYNDAEAIFDTELTFAWDFLQGLAGSDTVLTIESESIAVFGELSYELMDGKLIPLVGVRYFRDERSFSEAGVIGSGTPAEFPLPLATGDDVFKSWNPRFNLSYIPSADTMFYFNAAKGFRSGSQQTLVGVTAAQLDGINASQAIKDDSVWSYEIGGKFALWDNSLNLELAAYLSQYRDVQVQYITSLGLVSTITGGDSEVMGIEFGASWETPLEGLTLSANGSVLDTEWTDIDAAVEAAVPGIAEGDEVPWTPKWNYNLSANYNRPIGEYQGYAHVSYSRRGTQFSFTNDKSGQIKDLTLRLGLDSDHWGVYVFADNVLDERGPTLVSGSSIYTYTPRRVGLGLTLHM